MRESVAVISLNAIRHNVASLMAKTSPATFCAVVKADAYGHGMVPVAKASLQAGATWLAVALLEEAKELREHGFTCPILLLSELQEEDIADAVTLDLRITIYTEPGFKAAIEAAEKQQKSVLVHLKVNTGMNRVGAIPEDAVLLADKISAHPRTHLEGIWTHFAMADVVNAPMTIQQCAELENVISELAHRNISPDMTHAANSGAIFSDSRTYFDMVRCGISLYGPAPYSEVLEEAQEILQQVMQLKTAIRFIKTVPENTPISYGGRYFTSRKTQIATLPIGYADGIPRRLGLNGGEVLIHGKRCPIVGIVTMDQILVDCGDLPVQVGDEVVFYGKQGDEEITIFEVAQKVGTIANELLCAVGKRVPRVYIEE